MAMCMVGTCHKVHVEYLYKKKTKHSDVRTHTIGV
jgi:hypothetical protein